MKHIPVYSSTSFAWKGYHGTTEESKLVKLGSYAAVPDGWNGVAIESSKTGLVLLFSPIEDPSENGYDGEFMIYSYKDKYFVQIWNY